MTNTNLNRWLVEIIAALLILLFVYTAISKFQEQETFRTVLSRSPLIGSLGNVLAWLLPTVELLTAALLFIPAFRQSGLDVSLGLMCMFTAYISYMILFTPHLPCSCGGVLKQMTWRQHLGFNIFFTLLSILGLRLNQNNKRFIAINRESRIPV